MQVKWYPVRRVAAAAILTVIVLVGSTSILGDEPGRLGRFFRLRGNASSTPMTDTPAAGDAPVAKDAGAPVGLPMREMSPSGPVLSAPTAGVPIVGGTSPAPRLIPHARVSRAVTDADPIVTRITLGRTDDGHGFAMFLQVYADGTVIDSEGAHSLGRDAIRGVVETIESGELSRIHGHCGSPPTDFIEEVQMIVYERSFGRMRATSFSFSGNPQGCDHAVRHLQSLLDQLQTRLSPPAGAPTAGPTLPAAPPGTPVAPPFGRSPAGPIPLTVTPGSVVATPPVATPSPVATSPPVATSLPIPLTPPLTSPAAPIPLNEEPPHPAR